MSRSPVSLIFHDVVASDGAWGDSGFQGAGPAHYKFAAAAFRACLDAIPASAGAPSVTGADGALPPVDTWLLHFDDGGVSSLWVADELERRGWRGVFHIVSSLMGTPGFAPERDVVELSRRGHVVGSHSATHPDRMSALTGSELRHEWSTSKSVLEDVLGASVLVASVPGGYHSAAVHLAAADAGYRTLFTSEPIRRVSVVGGCAAVGRYSVVRSTSPAKIAVLVGGDRVAELRQQVGWEAKKVAKRIGGENYLRVRRAILARRP
jgi:peptidoglycan/xylan/chitin deacetylase (PgdA/CDA1 family)